MALIAAVLVLAAALPASAANDEAPVPSGVEVRAQARAAGGDRATALRVARVLLRGLLPAQLLKVRCERAREARFCGLTLSGVKFHRKLDVAAFSAEVDGLIAHAFAADPQVVEVDVWATVPADAGKGAVVSGDFALPSSATVFATTAHRGDSSTGLSPSRGRNAFWDPTFKRELERGTRE